MKKNISSILLFISLIVFTVYLVLREKPFDNTAAVAENTDDLSEANDLLDLNGLRPEDYDANGWAQRKDGKWVASPNGAVYVDSKGSTTMKKQNTDQSSTPPTKQTPPASTPSTKQNIPVQPVSLSVSVQPEISDPEPEIDEDLSVYRTDMPDPSIKNLPASIQNLRKGNAQVFIKSLASFINQNSSNDFDKVKKAHDWVALNIAYDTKSFFSGNTPSQSLGNVLAGGLAVCAGYSTIFKALCDALNIECVTIGGYGRGYGHSTFTVNDPTKSNHNWNKVRIRKKWYLIDSTWDAGYVDGQRYVQRYTTDYLFLEPDKFVCAHFPSNPSDQLLAKPLSASQFSNLPATWPRYFYALASGGFSPKVERINNAAGSFNLEYALNKGWDLYFKMYDETGTREIANRTFAQQGRAYFSFPEPGKYLIRGFAKKQGEETSSSCLEFGVVSTVGNPVMYPTTYSNFGAETRIFSPLEMPLKRGQNYTFNFKVDKPFAAVIIDRQFDKQWYKLRPDRNGMVSVNITIPENAQSVSLNDSDYENSTYWGLAKYTVE